MKKNEDKLTYYDFFWLFIVGGLFGYFYENVWYFLRKHILIIKNGVVFGPFQPIYAIGITLITLLLYKFKNKKWYQIIFLGAIIGTVFEYGASLFQDYAFGNYSWNYTKFGKLSINGRIYLPYCLGWGLITFIWIKCFMIKIINLFRKIPKKLNTLIVTILSIFMIFNLSLTCITFYRKTARYYNNYTNSKLEKIIDKHFDDDYMDKRFPNLWIRKK